MAKSYLDKDGLLYFWQKIKVLFVSDVTWDSTNKKIQKTKAGSTSDVVTLSTVATSGSYNDLSNKPTIPSAATSNPVMDGTAAVGSSAKYAKEDHVHPSDTSRVPTSRTVNGHALSSNVTVTNADLGQGYGTCSTAATTTAKAVTLSNYLLTTGGIITVKFTYYVPASATLNVNSKGAKSIYYKGSEITENIIRAGDTVTFLYDGSYYHVLCIDRTIESAITDFAIGNDAQGNLVAITFKNGSTSAIDENSDVIPAATTTVNGLMSAADKVKLNGIASGAEVNVNADWNATSGDAQILNKPTIPTLKNVFGKVKVGSTTIEADTTQDTLELVAGSSISLTPDATNDKVTIGCTITVDSSLSSTSTNPVQNKVVKASVDALENSIETLGTNIEAAIGAAGGICPLNDSTKVDPSYLPTASNSSFGAVKVDTALSSSSENPVQNKAINTALGNKINTSARGAANGVCPLNASSKIDATYLPSYVDDVIEAYARPGQTALSYNWLATGSASGTVISPEAGKIYVLMADSGDYAANTQFRWSITSYVKLADGGVSSITNAEIDTIVAA